MRPRILAALLLTSCVLEKRGAAPSASDPIRGKELIVRYNCAACHSIPGIPGPRGMVGPSLEHVAVRPFIGGKLPNSPATMTQWLQTPQAFDPASTMPNLGLTELEARNIAAYLFTLR